MKGMRLERVGRHFESETRMGIIHYTIIYVRSQSLYYIISIIYDLTKFHN